MVGRLLLCCILSFSVACSSSTFPDAILPDVSGDWRASQFIGHSLSVWELRVTQNGHAISGAACYSSNDFVAPTLGLVTGNYPAISFNDPGLLRPFTGAFDGKGGLVMTDGLLLSLSFVRLSDSELRWCLPPR
jgi:hypothetical protein